MGKAYVFDPEEEDRFKKEFPDAFKKARKEASLTQYDMGEILEKDQSFFSRLEKGKSFPSVFTLREIARITECSADSLLGISPWRKLLSHGSVDEQLYQAILSLDMEEKIHLLDEIQKKHQEDAI